MDFKLLLLALALLVGCGDNAGPDAAQACAADCECAGYPCNQGYCDHLSARRSQGLCYPGAYTEYSGPGDCGCLTGTCDERHCCITLDGAIARPFTPACEFLDATPLDATIVDAGTVDGS